MDSSTFNSNGINETYLPDSVYPGSGPNETAYVMIYPGLYPDVGLYPLSITLDNLVTDPPVEINENLWVQHYIEDLQVDVDPTHVKTTDGEVTFNITVERGNRFVHLIDNINIYGTIE